MFRKLVIVAWENGTHSVSCFVWCNTVCVNEMVDSINCIILYPQYQTIINRSIQKIYLENTFVQECEKNTFSFLLITLLFWKVIRSFSVFNVVK